MAIEQPEIIAHTQFAITTILKSSCFLLKGMTFMNTVTLSLNYNYLLKDECTLRCLTKTSLLEMYFFWI